MKVEDRADTQKEDGSNDRIRVFVIASDEKLIGYYLPREFRHFTNTGAQGSDACTCVRANT